MNRLPEIVLIGMNHKTAPVSVREQLALTQEDVDAALRELRREGPVSEALVFSTCNRVELVLVAEHTECAVRAVEQFLSRQKGVPVAVFSSHLYTHVGKDAVRHLFRVAASLDSLMVGEPQILGQVKHAYLCATRSGASGVMLNRMMHRAFQVAKRVRTETGIGDNAVSISYAATELARKIFGNLDGRKVLLVGAGEMAELAVEHLIKNRIGEIRVANRTFERGVALARRFGGVPIRMDELPDALSEVDILISSTGSPEYVITRDMVKPKMRQRQNRSLFLIDIAVPRDIDPKINRLDNAYVYDIDHLQGVVEENIREREKEAVLASRIVDEGVVRYTEWLDSLSLVPTIKALRSKLEGILSMEAKRTFQQIGVSGEEASAALDRMVEAMVTKTLHDPIRILKDGGCHRNPDVYLNMTRTLFHLDEETGLATGNAITDKRRTA